MLYDAIYKRYKDIINIYLFFYLSTLNFLAFDLLGSILALCLRRSFWNWICYILFYFPTFPWLHVCFKIIWSVNEPIIKFCVFSLANWESPNSSFVSSTYFFRHFPLRFLVMKFHSCYFAITVWLYHEKVVLCNWLRWLWCKGKLANFF